MSKIDSHIQNELTDVQNLKDGKYHQADSMYKRYTEWLSGDCQTANMMDECLLKGRIVDNA